MKCDLCFSGKAIIELNYLAKRVCKKCLERIERRRIIRCIRNFNLMQKGIKELGILFDFSPTSFFALYYFSSLNFRIFIISKENGKIPKNIKERFVFEERKNAKGINILVDPKCLDDFSTFFLENLFDGKFKFLEAKEGKIIRPFICIPEDEVKSILKIKGISGFKEVKRGEAYNFLLESERVRPGSMFSILRLFEKMKLKKF